MTGWLTTAPWSVQGDYFTPSELRDRGGLKAADEEMLKETGNIVSPQQLGYRQWHNTLSRVRLLFVS